MNANSQTTYISGPESTVLVKKCLKRTARKIGFQPQDIEELLIVVVELTTNIIKFASKGLITIRQIENNGKRGIQIKAINSGPGIENIERALGDGFSSVDNLGFGLGTIKRATHYVNIISSCKNSEGTEINCIRWVKPEPRLRNKINDDATDVSIHIPSLSSHVLKIGHATHRHPNMRVNGDSVYINHSKLLTTLGVIDGIGHGGPARRATRKTVEYLDRHIELTIDGLIKGASPAIRQTPGVVMSLARFGVNNHYFQHTGVGNILTRVYSNGKFTNLATRRGIVGGIMPPPLLTEHEFRPGDLLIFQSDGLKSIWDFNDFPWLKSLSVEEIANRLLEILTCNNDDATILIGRLDRHHER